MPTLYSLTYVYSQLQIIIQRNTRAHTPIPQLMSAQSSIVVLQVAQLIREVRSELDQLLQDKIENPHMDLCSCPRGNKIISTIVRLISTQ